MTDSTVFRIVSPSEWTTAQAAGHYRGAAHDARDGYLHLSTRHQVAGTLAKHYAGQADLVILAVDVAKLPVPLRYEPARDGELFPHLYAPLPVAAVTAVTPARDWRA